MVKDKIKTFKNIKIHLGPDIDPKIEEELKNKRCKRCKHTPCPNCYKSGRIWCDVISEDEEICCDGKCDLEEVKNG